MLTTLLLLAITVIILLLQKGGASIDLGFFDITMRKNIAYFVFMVIGCIIGFLLR